jgi:UDP-GlcNAc:undecaprenyl-phosphate GlcNAc-1-phosphate transferase
MLNSQFQNFILFVTSYFLVSGLTPLMRKIAITKEILDRPTSTHKSHTQAVPYLGGVAIILGIVVVTYTALLISDPTLSKFWLASSLIGPALVMGIIGLWDDIKNLHPLPRFISQTIAALIVAIILILTNNLGNPTGSITLDVLITLIWIVGICNSINFFDNLDGGAAGTAAISAITISYLALKNNQSFIGSLSLVLAGATLGFLIWNRSPARIYMGDAGALFLGVLLATLTIRLKPEAQSSVASFATPILVLAVPILDTCVAVISRLRRKVSPFQGGKDHLSHRLIRYKFSRKSAAIILWLLSVYFCLVAVGISKVDYNYEILSVILAALTWVILFIGFIRVSDS